MLKWLAIGIENGSFSSAVTMSLCDVIPKPGCSLFLLNAVTLRYLKSWTAHMVKRVETSEKEITVSEWILKNSGCDE